MFKIELPASVRSELEMNIHIMVSQLIVGGEALSTVVTPETHCITVGRGTTIHGKKIIFVENLYTKLTPEPHLTIILVHCLQGLLHPRDLFPTEVAGCLGFVDRHMT